MTPYLLNMSDDVSLAGCLMYPLQLNERTSIGSDPDNTVVVHGLGVLPWLGEAIFQNAEANRRFGAFFSQWLYVVLWLAVQNLWYLGVWHHNIPDYLVGLRIELQGLLQLFNARTCLFTWHPFDAQHPCRPCLWIGKVDKNKHPCDTKEPVQHCQCGWYQTDVDSAGSRQTTCVDQWKDHGARECGAVTSWPHLLLWQFLMQISLVASWLSNLIS